MTKGEVDAIEDTLMLRGGNPGLTYFTDQSFKSSKRAKKTLALETEPTHKMNFRVINDPKTVRRNKAKSANGEPGGGQELFTSDPVHVEIINIQKLK